MIPYGRHEITEADRQAVLDALDSGWLTGGPTSRAFEADLGRVCGAPAGILQSTVRVLS